MKKAISLFTGAGGMDIGFKKAGFKIILANELMREASETYSKNNPDTKMINDDINNIMSLFNEYNDIDLIFGGPPCQGFSVAGKMDPNDERSKLIFTFLDVVKVVRPKMFVMENVKALGLLGKWASIRDEYFKKIELIGYHCITVILNATDFGVSQKRERVFFIGIKKPYLKSFDNDIIEEINKGKKKAIPIKALLKDLGPAGTEKNPNTCTAKITFATKPIMRNSPYSGMYVNGQGRPINVDGYANTLPASMGGNKTPFVDEEYLYGESNEDWMVAYHKGLLDGKITPTFTEAPKRLRRITIKEAMRIQSFPDSYNFYGNTSKIYTQIGNAVPPKLAEAVATAVYKYLKKVEE